jgi:hypothetical protein
LRFPFPMPFKVSKCPKANNHAGFLPCLTRPRNAIGTGKKEQVVLAPHGFGHLDGLKPLGAQAHQRYLSHASMNHTRL